MISPLRTADPQTYVQVKSMGTQTTQVDKNCTCASFYRNSQMGQFRGTLPNLMVKTKHVKTMVGWM
jgi:hypothetical protein